MKTLTTVYWVFEADFLCSQLAIYGIKTNIPDQFTAGVFPLISNAMGGVRIQVDDEDFDRAVSALCEIRSTSKDSKQTSCLECDHQREEDSWEGSWEKDLREKEKNARIKNTSRRPICNITAAVLPFMTLGIIMLISISKHTWFRYFDGYGAIWLWFMFFASIVISFVLSIISIVRKERLWGLTLLEFLIFANLTWIGCKALFSK